MSFVRARIGACVSACTILDCKKICDSPLTSGTAALFCEFRETRTGPCVEPVFFRAQGRADLGQINDEGRILPCTEGSGDL